MTKAELIAAIMEKTGTSKSETDNMFNAIFVTIADAHSYRTCDQVPLVHLIYNAKLSPSQRPRFLPLPLDHHYPM